MNIVFDRSGAIVDAKTQGSKYSVVERQQICDEMLELVRQGLSETRAALQVKLPKTTLYRWKREDPKFSRELKAVRNEDNLTLAQENMRTLLKSKNPQTQSRATMFMLKHYDDDASTKVRNTNETLDIMKAHEELRKMHGVRDLGELDKKKKKKGKVIDADVKYEEDQGI